MPPYQITSRILQLISTISEQIGEVRASRLDKPPRDLQRTNRIRTVHSSLAIEGNTLSIEQITAVLNGERVVGPPNDILEVRNAISAYDMMDKWKPFDVKSFCRAHGVLMKELVERPGVLRSSAVGILRGNRLTHLAPPGEMVAPLVKNLFEYVKTDDAPLILRSCVFHYEIELIHPFTDGNGRIGRLWQTVILRKHAGLFEFLPLEPLINARREQYYEALAASDKEGQSTAFVEFMLDALRRALDEMLETRPVPFTVEERISRFEEAIGSKAFTRSDYMAFHKSISSATASRDLKAAVDDRRIEMSGDKRTAEYRFID